MHYWIDREPEGSKISHRRYLQTFVEISKRKAIILGRSHSFSWLQRISPKRLTAFHRIEAGGSGKAQPGPHRAASQGNPPLCKMGRGAGGGGGDAGMLLPPRGKSVRCQLGAVPCRRGSGSGPVLDMG